MTASPVLVEWCDDRTATLTLNAPDTRNAITLEMAAAVEAAVHELTSGPDCSVIIVTGAGPAFCAGADRSVLARADREALTAVYRTFLAIREAEVATLAAVNGPAVGAGLNLALACDIRVASTAAVFDPRFMKLGVHGGGGVSWMLERAVGAGAATAMLLFGEVVDGRRAEQIGLAWECVPAEHLLERSRAIARIAAAADPRLVRLTKDTLKVAGATDRHADMVHLELDRQAWSFLAEQDRAPWRSLLHPVVDADRSR